MGISSFRRSPSSRLYSVSFPFVHRNLLWFRITTVVPSGSAISLNAAFSAFPFYTVLQTRAAMVAHYYGHGALAGWDMPTTVASLLGISWVIGFGGLAAGMFIARRNLETILGAQDE